MELSRRQGLFWLFAKMIIIPIFILLVDAMVMHTSAAAPRNISQARMYDIPVQSYTGKRIKPDITVKYHQTILIEGEDYLIFYHNNVRPGTATAGVIGIGLYRGIKPISFRISSEIGQTVGFKQNIRTADMVQFAWLRLDGVDGYEVFRRHGAAKQRRIATVPGKTTVFIDRLLRPSTAYLYRVRAFKYLNGKICYGEFSKRLRITTEHKRKR